jgi:hypothetical protein
MELPDHVAERRHVQLVAWRNFAECLARQRDLTHKLLLIAGIEIDDLGKVSPPWHEQQPRVLRVTHQPHGRERQVQHMEAVGLDPRIESKVGHVCSFPQSPSAG